MNELVGDALESDSDGYKHVTTAAVQKYKLFDPTDSISGSSGSGHWKYVGRGKHAEGSMLRGEVGLEGFGLLNLDYSAQNNTGRRPQE